MNLTKQVLVCRDENQKIKFLDVDACRRRYMLFGPYEPTFKCGSDKNVHTCEPMTNLQIEYFRSTNPLSVMKNQRPFK